MDFGEKIAMHVLIFILLLTLSLNTNVPYFSGLRDDFQRVKYLEVFERSFSEENVFNCAYCRILMG